VDAKNGTQNTMIAAALETGNCTLRAEVMVTQIRTNDGGRVTGLRYVDTAGQTTEVSAEVVILSCGAVETARLLLNSTTPQEPQGMGNASDQVGRHLQGHYYPGAAGIFEQEMWDGLGPGASVATCEFNHDNEGIIGGGMLADEDIVLPVIFWKRDHPSDVPRWGQAGKTFMRENYRRFSDVKGPVQEFPHPDGRVTIDPAVRDRYGLPVAHFSGTTHPETVRTAQFMRDRAV
jgi:choline dehydrogenase-like flavoprotein